VLFKDLKQAGWGVKLPFTQNALSGFMLENFTRLENPPRPPAGLYNAMIAPLTPFPLRGAIWYQGESNAPRAHQYRVLLPALIVGWRRAWKEGDLAFGVVQLPNHGERPAEPAESMWAEMREAQAASLRVPNTGLATTIDVGEAANVHPHRKREVGERLASWALATSYGRQVEYSGPLYQAMQVERDHIRVRFTHGRSGLEARNGALRGFAIAGADRHFHWADARIDGDTVVVSSPAVPRPVAVRYAWADDPDCNLFNKDGLPASPFRTDDWPGITMDQH
jgi:sialate O-acetylesterase